MTEFVIKEVSPGVKQIGDDTDTPKNGLKNKESNPQSITIPNEVSIIGAYAFYGCRSLQYVEFHNNIIEIRRSAFNECSLQFSSLVLPNSLVVLSRYAFASNYIKEIVLNSALSKIDSCPFGNNPGLKKMTVPKENLYYCNDLQYALYTKNMRVLIQAPCEIEHFSIPNTVRKILFKAFDRSKIKELIIPATVTEVQDYATYACINLVTLYIHTPYINVNKAFYGYFKEVYYFSITPIHNNIIFIQDNIDCKFFTCQDYLGQTLSGYQITQKIGECSNYHQMTCFKLQRVHFHIFELFIILFI